MRNLLSTNERLRSSFFDYELIQLGLIKILIQKLERNPPQSIYHSDALSIPMFAFRSFNFY